MDSFLFPIYFLSGGRLLVFFYVEPEDNVLESSSSLTEGHYSRILKTSSSSSSSSSTSSSAASSNSSTSSYSPEGSEYSIYYKGQYLYITPDIFTGLMTGLFFVFVLYIGLGRLSAIQVTTEFK